jgi:RimJ/RimL family protein N-acetyltransferase
MLYSKRLRLRAAEKTDIPRFVTWLNDPEVTQFLLIAYPMSQAFEEKWFESMIERGLAEQVLVIERKVDDDYEPIGNTSFMHIDWVSRNAEIGIFLGEKKVWSQGYGREAMKLMLRYGFNQMNLHRISLQVYEHNIRGIKAYEHAGFVHEGRLRQDVFKEGVYRDVLIMAVIRPEWQDEEF